MFWGLLSPVFEGALKLQDMKMTDQLTGHENAGHEIAGQKRAVRLSVCLYVRHALALCQNDSCYDHDCGLHWSIAP